MSAIVDCSCSSGCGYVKYGAAILAVAATIVASWRLAKPWQHYLQQLFSMGPALDLDRTWPDPKVRVR